jgi:hypothetical protein
MYLFWGVEKGVRRLGMNWEYIPSKRQDKSRVKSPICEHSECAIQEINANTGMKENNCEYELVIMIRKELRNLCWNEGPEDTSLENIVADLSVHSYEPRRR